MPSVPPKSKHNLAFTAILMAICVILITGVIVIALTEEVFIIAGVMGLVSGIAGNVLATYLWSIYKKE